MKIRNSTKNTAQISTSTWPCEVGGAHPAIHHRVNTFVTLVVGWKTKSRRGGGAFALRQNFIDYFIFSACGRRTEGLTLSSWGCNCATTGGLIAACCADFPGRHCKYGQNDGGAEERLLGGSHGRTAAHDPGSVAAKGQPVVVPQRGGLLRQPQLAQLAERHVDPTVSQQRQHDKGAAD